LDPEIEASLTDFNKKFESIEADMDIVKEKIEKLKKTQQKALNATITSERVGKLIFFDFLRIKGRIEQNGCFCWQKK
jgi:hypothetical protein